MRIIEAFSNSIHATIVHDGIRIFRANELAVKLFGYESSKELAAVGIAGIVAPESKWLSAKRVEQLRKHPDQNLPDAQLTLIRKDKTCFVASVHTKTLRWAFLENFDDMAELRNKLETDIIFYSWVGEDIQECP